MEEKICKSQEYFRTYKIITTNLTQPICRPLGANAKPETRNAKQMKHFILRHLHLIFWAYAFVLVVMNLTPDSSMAEPEMKTILCFWTSMVNVVTSLIIWMVL